MTELKSPEGNDMSWPDYWEKNTGDNGLFHGIAADYYRNFQNRFSTNSRARILDFGCGPGYLALMLGGTAAKVYAFDQSKGMRDSATARTRSMANVTVVDHLNEETVEPLDYVVANSVLQYMTMDEVRETLNNLRNLLRSEGEIILSDVLGEPLDAKKEVFDLLLRALLRGYFIAQFWRFFSLFFSNYSRVSKTTSLTVFKPQALAELAKSCGFEFELLDQNLVGSRQRYSASLRPTGGQI